MFIFDFVADTVLDQIVDWIYGKIVGFLSAFFAMMNNMGVELFELPWVQAVTDFFGYLGWTLFVVGIAVGAFECAIEYQGGRGSVRDTALNYVKGFMAVSLFTVVPVKLYALCVSLQGSFGSAISGITNTEGIGVTVQDALLSAAIPGIGNPILHVGQDKCIVEKNRLVRKLVPLECERLMGFPDYWTDIPGASDSARYKALGNSVAVPCVDFILCGIAYFLSAGEEEKDVYLSG